MPQPEGMPVDQSADSHIRPCHESCFRHWARDSDKESSPHDSEEFSASPSQGLGIGTSTTTSSSPVYLPSGSGTGPVADWQSDGDSDSDWETVTREAR